MRDGITERHLREKRRAHHQARDQHRYEQVAQANRAQTIAQDERSSRDWTERSLAS
jgi:hypothetical protein